MKIEKNITLAKNGAGRPAGKTIWHQIEVGDSVLLGKPGDKLRQHASKGQSARNVTGNKFSLRTVPEGVRIWRVA